MIAFRLWVSARLRGLHKCSKLGKSDRGGGKATPARRVSVCSRQQAGLLGPEEEEGVGLVCAADYPQEAKVPLPVPEMEVGRKIHTSHSSIFRKTVSY